MRAEAVQNQQAGELKAAENLILQQKVANEEKKADLMYKIQLRQAELGDAKLDETARHNAATELAQMKMALAAMTRAERPLGSEEAGGVWAKGPDGNTKYYRRGEVIPTGWIPLSENPTDASTSNQVTIADTLRKYDAEIPGKNEEEGQAYVDLFNKFDPKWEYKWLGDPPIVVNGVKIPFTGSKKWTKVPKTSSAPVTSQGSAPSAAVEHLKKNPHLKEEFKLKYGYIPEGI